ncbi:zinc finger, C2H2 type [Dictyocaulus viviparus]|uniref:Zinc finger, C2H2 type n=1 Tax=Dictyocaulus viviparus TaxID=29172 RepID=A0A0D8Y8Z4_DICVI|nr:zinc finger, C2H2 type [Dictyocaulus viviparus]
MTTVRDVEHVEPASLDYLCKFAKNNTISVVSSVPSTLVPNIHHGTTAAAAATAIQPPNVILFPVAYHDHQHEVVQKERKITVFHSAPTGLKRTVERPISTPLDLSKRRRDDDSGSSGTATPTNAARTSHSDVEKPFLCACGISFSADETLKAHRQYYCKMVERRIDNRDPPKKVKARCSQCEYEPGSLSQLSVHVRTVHNEVQAYVCRLCGYRGFSLRGIRSHMRSHSELDAMKFEFLLANHIAKVKTERKTPENQESMDQE